MSPDQYHGNTKLQQADKQFREFSKAYPKIATLFSKDITSFRGLSIWQSDSDEWVCALRGYRDDDLPGVSFISGWTLDELLFNLNKRANVSDAIIDKRAMSEKGLSLPAT